MDLANMAIDYEMLIRLKASDQQAFDFFYRKYRSRVYGNILKFVKSDEFATDILQEVFVSIWKNRSGLDTEQSFDHYILKIARNKVFDFFRKVARDKKLEERLINLAVGQEYNPLIDELHLKEDFVILHQEIERLPEKCKTVFKICKIEGKSYEEVSKLLNISLPTVNNHIVRATKILKKNLSANDFLLFFLFTCFF